MFRDMGWRVAEWHAVENNVYAVRVAGEMYGGRVTHVCEKVQQFRCEQRYDVVLAGPPCRPWSRLNKTAKGFRDERSRVFTHCCRIIREAIDVNPKVKFMLENVVIPEKLKQDELTQEELLMWYFEEMNAKDVGAQSSRPRRVAQNVVASLKDLDQRSPVDPNLSLNWLGAASELRVTGCVVASAARSKASVKVHDVSTGDMRNASLQENEALMGHVVGTADAHGKVQMEYEQRAAIIGNGFHYEMLRAIFSEMEPVRRRAVVVQAVTGSRSGLSKQESYLSSLTRGELRDELARRWGDRELPRLSLKLKDENTTPFQANVRARYSTPESLRASVKAELKKRLKAGRMKLVVYSPEMWISMMFAK